MQKDRSLIYAYLLDGKGGGTKLTWKEIKAWSPEQGILWIHLNYTVQNTIKWLNKESGLDKITAKAMAVDESRPRSLISNKGIMVFLRGVNSNPGQEPEDMVSLRLWIDEHRIISTRKRPLLSIDDIQASIERGNGPKTTAEFLRMTNDFLLDRISNVLETIDDEVAELEEQVLTSESYMLRPKIADLQRQMILIRRYLAPQREALNKLHIDESAILTSTDRLYLREANDRIVRYIEDLDSAKERAAITQEELKSKLSEQLDSRMYRLSVVAVIFLPLSFITGLLGINVAGIPGTNYKWAFTLVCIALFGVMVAMLYYFRKKKWI